MSSTISPQVPRWTHTDSDPEIAVKLAFSAGLGKTPEEQLRGFRGLMAASASAMTAMAIPADMLKPMKRAPEAPANDVHGVANSGGAGSTDKYGTDLDGKQLAIYGERNLHFFSSQQEKIAASIARSFYVLCPRGTSTLYNVTTHNGDLPAVYMTPGEPKRDVTMDPEAGALPALLVAGIVVVAICGAVYGLVKLAEITAPVLHDAILGRETTARMVAQTQSLVQLALAHEERDAQSGVHTPYSQVEEQARQDLLGLQNKVLEQEKALTKSPSGPPPTRDGFSNLFDSLPMILGAGAVAYAVTR